MTTKRFWITFAVIIITFYIFTLVWSYLSPGTWDDDCANRFYNTLRASENPAQFYSLWNRPLWIVLFYFPVKLGTFGVPIFMGLFSALGAYWLVKGMRNYGFSDYLSLLAIPFFLYQPYFFSVARNAMTEPLAAVIIAGGFYFLSEKKYLNFAILGSLLPLARIELIPIVMLWGLILLLNKKYKYIVILPLGVLLLNISGYLIVDVLDSPTWFFDSLLAGESEENRYGHFPFNTYMMRYIYVISPIIFFFFIAGLVARVKKVKISTFDIFVYGQFLLSFFLYTIFAWKLNVGDSAAFLRNLLSFSSLTAIIAVLGFQFLFPSGFSSKKSFVRLLIGLVFCLALVLMTYNWFSVKLIMHHSRSDEFYKWNLIPIIILSVLVLVYSQLKFKPFVYKSILLLITIGTMSFCLITENYKDFGVNPERTALAKVASVISSSKIGENKLYCNHTWYHWSNDLNIIDTTRYGNMKKVELENADSNSIFIWENHYSNRLTGDVPAAYFTNNKQTKLLFGVLSSDEKFQAQVYLKNNNISNTQLLDVYTDLLKSDSNYSSVRLARGDLLFAMNRIEEAKADYQNIANQKQFNTFDYYQMARRYLYQLKDYKAASVYLNNVTGEGNVTSRFYNSLILDLGTSYSYMEMINEAIQTFDVLIKRDPNNQVGLVNLGINYYRKNDLNKACELFKRAGVLGNQQAKDLQIQLNCQ